MISCSYSLTAQITDSTTQQSGFNRVSENIVSNEEIELQIKKLITEINTIDNEDLTHDMSVAISHQIMNQGQASLLHSEIERLKVRQDFYQNYSDYILPLEDLNIQLLPQIKSALLQNLETFKQERFIGVVLAKSLLNILYIQKDYKKYIEVFDRYSQLFSLQDKDIMMFLSQAYAAENNLKRSFDISENLYLAHPTDADVFFNHMHNLVYQKEFAELEFYLSDLLVYNDVKSLIALSIHYFSQEKIVEGHSLIAFIEPFIEKNLFEEFQWSIQDFNWNYNKDNITIKTEGGGLGRTQRHHSLELYDLAQYLEISDSIMSCRFQKYAYIATHSDIKNIYDSDINIYMEDHQQAIIKKQLTIKRDAILNLQKEILKNRCQ